jgi:hypothetical protein
MIPEMTMNTEREQSTRKVLTPSMVIGICMILLGLMLMVDNLVPGLHILRFVFDLWPLIFVAIGLTKYIAAERENRSRSSGIIFMSVGLILLMVTVGHRHLEDLFGPMIIVAIGIGVVVMSLKRHRKVPPELQRSDGFLNGTVILSGMKRRVATSNFQGGEITAIFGGFELDLRQASMASESARLDVFILFGGGHIKLPEHWEVQNHLFPIAGGVEDKTSHMTPAGQQAPTLVLTGMTIFGGLELRN